MLHLPDSLMNRLNQTESADFRLCSFTVIPRDPFFRLFSLFDSLLIHGFCKTRDKMVWVEYLNVLI